MHNVKPNQMVRIITIQVAVPADACKNEVIDRISSLLDENGVCSSDGIFLDWQYTGHDRTVCAPDRPEECEIFKMPSL